MKDYKLDVIVRAIKRKQLSDKILPYLINRVMASNSLRHIKAVNVEMYLKLKEVCEFNGGHIATYNEILRAGKGHINPFLAIEISIFLLIVLITMGLI